jgi:geranylgeranyl pyrophosphate synthase
MISRSDRRRRASPAPSSEGASLTWSSWLAGQGPRIEQAILAALPHAGRVPVSLRAAMKYALFPGGKRLRPALVVLGHRACGGRHPEVYRLAATCEFVHTFTLIHDDLPCMDDDDLRRGRPTCHKVYGEAIAVLAGDALLNLAFEVIASLRCDGERKGELVGILSRAVGGGGVLGGQVEDIEAERVEIKEKGLKRIHERKTASLIAASLEMGGVLAGAGRTELVRLRGYGLELGRLFQIVDDLLNVEGTEAELGRPAGGDERLAKATFPRIVGLDGTRRRISARAGAARRAAAGLNGMQEIFEDLVHVVAGRVRSAPGRSSR